MTSEKTHVLKTEEIVVKSIITKSNLPAASYVVNPYIGCQHGCIYCYSEFMKRFTNHHEPWGTFVDVKINAVNIIKPMKYKDKQLLFSSVTDAYQPIESKYELTRKLLMALIPGQPKIEILTKSSLVLRDLDILKQFEDVTVGVSISTLDRKISRQLEPLASSPGARLQALKRCKEEGIRTYTFLSPLIPFITDVAEIIKETIPYSDFLMFENLNIRPTNLNKVQNVLEKISPDLPLKLKKIYAPDSKYWDNEEERWRTFCEKEGIEALFFFHHGKE